MRLIRRVVESSYFASVEASFLVLLISFFWSLYLSSFIPVELSKEWDVWYGSDIPRVVQNMVDIESYHERTKVHPVFSFLILPPTRLLALVMGDTTSAVRVICAIFSALTILLIFLFVRIQSNDLRAAILTASLGMSSSAYVFWFSVPETFLFGAASISLSFLFLVLPRTVFFQFVLMNFTTLAFTTTNWVVGILVTFARWRTTSALLIVSTSFIIAIVLSWWQKVFISSSSLFFLPSAVSDEPTWMVLPWSDGALDRYIARAVNFFIYGIVSTIPGSGFYEGKKTVGSQFLGFDGIGWIAVVLWLSIFAVGLLGIWKKGVQYSIGTSVLGFLAFQFVLHLIYGDEPFLYSAHFLPAFCIIASFAFVAGYAKFMQLLGWCLVGLLIVNNFSNFYKALNLLM